MTPFDNNPRQKYWINIKYLVIWGLWQLKIIDTDILKFKFTFGI